jgi:membrane associated rhomboid family serine protease
LSLSPDGGDAAVLGLGAIPAVLFGDRSLDPDLVLIPSNLTLITSMFLHAGWMHLIGNMLFLWVFGENVEDCLGHRRFILFYFLSGIGGGLAHALVNPDSAAPMIGASGPISGILGAYLVLHPRPQALVLAFMYIPVRLPAFVILGLWVGLQMFNASVTGSADGGGTAWWAHIGGFITGIVLLFLLRKKTKAKSNSAGPWGERNSTTSVTSDIPNPVDRRKR